MNHLTVIQTSLSFSFVGLLLLFAILLFSDPEEIKISEVQSSKFEDVKLEGYVRGIRKFDSVSIIDLAEIKSVEVVVFDDRILPEINDAATVSGEIREYKGKKQIIAHSIKKS